MFITYDEFIPTAPSLGSSVSHEEDMRLFGLEIKHACERLNARFRHFWRYLAEPKEKTA